MTKNSLLSGTNSVIKTYPYDRKQQSSCGVRANGLSIMLSHAAHLV